MDIADLFIRRTSYAPDKREKPQSRLYFLAVGYIFLFSVKKPSRLTYLSVSLRLAMAAPTESLACYCPSVGSIVQRLVDPIATCLPSGLFFFYEILCIRSSGLRRRFNVPSRVIGVLLPSSDSQEKK